MAIEGDQAGPVGWSVSAERTQSYQGSANESSTTASALLRRDFALSRKDAEAVILDLVRGLIGGAGKDRP